MVHHHQEMMTMNQFSKILKSADCNLRRACIYVGYVQAQTSDNPKTQLDVAIKSAEEGIELLKKAKEEYERDKVREG